MRYQFAGAVLVAAALAAAGCARQQAEKKVTEPTMKERLAKYAQIRLETDPSGLTDKERQMIPLLIDAAKVMDDLFWLQTYGDKQALLAKVNDPDTRRFVEINYGPWDRLDGNRPFVPGVGPKPPGANFYPVDMTKDQFEAAVSASPDSAKQLKSLYTLVTRPAGGGLVAVALPRGLRAPTQGSRGETSGGGQARRRPRPAEVPGLARPGAPHGRLQGQRHRLARHEDQHRGRRHRADRNLRRRVVRLQGLLRSLRAGEGQGVEQAAGALRRASAGPANGAARRGGVQAREAGHGLGPERLRRPLSTRATATRARRPSPSTFRTTRTSSSRRARGGCSSRTPCARSSTRFWSPSPTS